MTGGGAPRFQQVFPACAHTHQVFAGPPRDIVTIVPTFAEIGENFAPSILVVDKFNNDAHSLVGTSGDFTFDEASIVDRPECRWSPYHGRKMRARVAATYLRGHQIWDGTAVLNKPGDGAFVKRQTA